MEFDFLQSIKPGLLIALVVETVIFIGWAINPEKVKKLYLLAGIVLAGCFVILERAVETDKEQLIRITRQIVQEAEEENASAIISHLSDNFHLSNGYDKSQAAQAIREKLDSPLIQSNMITRLEVTQVSADRGRVEFTVLTTFEPKNKFGPATYPIKTSWRFDYVRDRPDAEYKVKDMTMLDSNTGKPFDVFKFKGRF